MAARPPSLKSVDLEAQHPLDDATYAEQLGDLQRACYRAQTDVFTSGRKVVLVFEGWDAAGKGGAIKRLTAELDPRGYKVWPIGAPSEDERRQHYLARFMSRLPGPGEIAVFDRSWYGRVLVERVERFAPEAAWRRAYEEINAFERAFTADGVTLLKLFLHIDKATQLERFHARAKDPYKRHKLGPEDWRNRRKWPAYEAALKDVFARTHRPHAPWTVVPANDKRFARLEVLRRCLRALRAGARGARAHP